MNETIVGTCSICGGPVTVPTMWMGIFPPTPECKHCGAHAQEAYGPTIPMVPAKPTLPDWDKPKRRRLYPGREDYYTWS